jgi:class 3 adenylate cyclase/predicted ATPase
MSDLTAIPDIEASRLRAYLSPAQIEAPPSLTSRAVREQLARLLDVVTAYLPRYLVSTELNHLAHDQQLYGGEFLSGALLFADISGFTALSERLSKLGREGAEQVTEIINRYFETMLAIIFAHGGDLFKFGGDALLVFFPDGDLPGSISALQASHQMQQAMAAFTQVKTTFGPFPLQMKIGLSAGSIFTGRLGTATDRQFIVTGSVVNATARAESASTAGQILITPNVYAALDTPHSPFRFVPAPHDHYLLDSIISASITVAASPVAQPALRRSDDVHSIVTALDRLTPYLPAGLLPRLIAEPAQHRASGEHRLVGVLFANFLGASDLIDQLGPDHAEQIAGQLNHYLVRMQTAITRYGGVVNKIDLYDHGDKLMALFGAPIAHEDDAERTLRAALDMQAAEQDAGPIVFQQSLGVNAGVVFAGHVGSDERREYTVMGDDVNLAARLMSAARPGELLLSNAIRRKAAPFFEIVERGAIKVKGKGQPVPIYSVGGKRAQPEAVRGIRGLHSPLVGRGTEIDLMRALAGDVRSGQGRILALIGEAGLGKSRLIAELRSGLATTECVCLESHCLSYTQNVSYSAFTAMIRAALGITATDGESEVWAKLRHRLDELLSTEAASDIVPYLARFLSLPLSDALAERVAYLEGEALQRQVIRAVVTLLEGFAAQHPLLLVFDDLHWADSASLVMLERTLALAERAPVLIALLYRPERSHGVWSLGETAVRTHPAHCVEVTLHPLDVQRGEDQVLVRNLLSMDSVPSELARLIGRAEGNPFYIEEIIRTLIDAGAIVQRAGQWQMSGGIALPEVPDSLQGIIMARIDRLLEEARRTLQLASVVGRTFRYLVLNWLASAVALAQQLNTSLTSLQRAELVREHSRLPELEYAFEQAMFRDVAYESLLLRDRRAYHRLVGQLLEETHPDQRDAVIELLAHHYSLSDEQAKALTYLIQAGDKTRFAYANQEAINFYRQAAALAESIGTTDDRAAIAAGLGDVYYHIGEYDSALAQFTAALRDRHAPAQLADLHRRIGAVYEKRGEYVEALTSAMMGMTLLMPDQAQTVEMARLLTLRCRIHHQQGRFEDAIDAGEQALAIVEDSAHYQEIAQAHNELGNAYESLGQINRAIQNYERGLIILERIGDEHGAARIYGNLAIIYYQTDLEQAAAYFGRTLETMQRLGDVWGESNTYQNLGIIQFAQGHYAQAIDDYARSLSMKERLGDSQGIADCHINLGETYRAQGDLAQAIDHLRKSLAVAEAIGSEQTVAEAYRQLAECYLEDEDSGPAAEAAIQSLEHAQAIGDRSREGVAHRVLGRALQQHGEMRLALAHLETSATILRELNSDLDLAWACYDYGLALAKSGETTTARERLAEAQAIFARLQLRQEQAKAQAALEQVS